MRLDALVVRQVLIPFRSQGFDSTAAQRKLHWDGLSVLEEVLTLQFKIYSMLLFHL